MKRAGKGSIWELRVNDEYVCAGTQEQIAEYIGMTVLTLRNMVEHSKKPKYKIDTFYDLILLRDSRPTYKMIFEDGESIKGTVKELSEKSNYSYSYLINVAKGLKKPRYFKMLQVG